MAILEVNVCNEKRKLYMDNYLHKSISSKIIPKIKKKDFDWVWVVDGGEGSGKSVLAQQLAKVLDPNFNIDRMCMTPKEFTKAILRAKKGQCVVFDEAFTGLSSRASLTEINKLLVSLMMEMRQKNLFVIIVMPTFFLLDRYVALFRARGLFHVYLKGGKRGRWIYFNNKKKKLLYLMGKKLYDYSKPRSSFRGRFMDQYTINEGEYRKKKGEALREKSRSTRAETYKSQRDTLFWILHKKFKQNQAGIARVCKEFGYSIDRRTIGDVFLEKRKVELQDEIEKEEQQREEVEVPTSTPKTPNLSITGS
jgi:energy-coupling factor transporter ATP-binding protein EcfA2